MTKSLVALVSLAWLSSGCGSSDDEKPKLGEPPMHPVPGCEHVEHRPCDIRVPRCQEQLMELAACLRGSEPLPVPPVTIMTEEEFLAYLNQDIPENPPPDPNHYEIALTLLRLVERGALAPEARAASDVKQLWGVYRDTEKDILIIDHGVPADEPTPNLVLVHEFIHALQDSDVDLNAFFDEYSTSYDSYLGVASVTEGEARFHESRYFAALLGLDPAAIDWTEHFQSITEFAEDEILASPSPYVATWGYFPYAFGARLAHHAWATGGPAGIDALFASPPTRAVAVMNSVSDVASADWPAPDFTELEPPEPWALWTETSLGAWGLFLYLSGLGTPTATRASSLLGDRLAVYVASGTPGETAVVWQLEFSSDVDAAQVEARARQASFSAFRDGSRVVLARSTGTSPLDWALVP